jgi:ferritin-like metal-binding protein YciE
MGLNDVMLDQLRDLYSAESQLVKALPKLAKAAENDELKQAFLDHFDETRGHVDRLKQVFTILEDKPTGKHCKGMEGLIEEGTEAIDEAEEGDPYDVRLIGAAVRVEHYEIAGYTAVIAMARGLGQEEVARLLDETLTEENTAREKLEGKAEELIAAASDTSEGEEEDGEEPDEAKTAKTNTSRKSTRR